MLPSLMRRTTPLSHYYYFSFDQTRNLQDQIMFYLFYFSQQQKYLVQFYFQCLFTVIQKVQDIQRICSYSRCEPLLHFVCFLSCLFLCFTRYTFCRSFLTTLNELNDYAGQHEVIAENLTSQIIAELTRYLQDLKTERKSVRRLELDMFCLLLSSKS